jgi:zinc-ribbon domain
MIVNCPSCFTRYNLPAMASSRVAMTCRACGHHWREIETIDAIDITESPQRSLTRLVDHDDAPDHVVSRLAQLARSAQEDHDIKVFKRRRRLQQWAVFGSFVLAPFVAAGFMPETVVSAAPISIKAYEALGYDINLYGLEVRGVEREHVVMDGQRILAIKGQISNLDETVRKIPWLRFALLGPSGEELYTWTLDTASKPLRPGESTSFVTRLSAPPEAAANVQIRFARADEIGLKQGHDPTPKKP